MISGYQAAHLSPSDRLHKGLANISVRDSQIKLDVQLSTSLPEPLQEVKTSVANCPNKQCQDVLYLHSLRIGLHIMPVTKGKRQTCTGLIFTPCQC